MSTTDAELDEKLARLSGRLQAQRDRVRAELAKEPGLLLLAEGLRAAFGGRLTWLKTDTFEHGQELPRGVVPAEAFDVKRRKHRG